MLYSSEKNRNMSTEELENAKKQINLRVLSKYDHHITSIIETTSHVVLYDFNMSSKDWVGYQCIEQSIKLVLCDLCKLNNT